MDSAARAALSPSLSAIAPCPNPSRPPNAAGSPPNVVKNVMARHSNGDMAQDMESDSSCAPGASPGMEAGQTNVWGIPDGHGSVRSSDIQLNAGLQSSLHIGPGDARLATSAVPINAVTCQQGGQIPCGAMWQHQAQQQHHVSSSEPVPNGELDELEMLLQSCVGPENGDGRQQQMQHAPMHSFPGAARPSQMLPASVPTAAMDGDQEMLYDDVLADILYPRSNGSSAGGALPGLSSLTGGMFPGLSQSQAPCSRAESTGAPSSKPSQRSAPPVFLGPSHGIDTSHQPMQFQMQGSTMPQQQLAHAGSFPHPMQHHASMQAHQQPVPMSVDAQGRRWYSAGGGAAGASSQATPGTPSTVALGPSLQGSSQPTVLGASSPQQQQQQSAEQPQPTLAQRAQWYAQIQTARKRHHVQAAPAAAAPTPSAPPPSAPGASAQVPGTLTVSVSPAALAAAQQLVLAATGAAAAAAAAAQRKPSPAAAGATQLPVAQAVIPLSAGPCTGPATNISASPSPDIVGAAPRAIVNSNSQGHSSDQAAAAAAAAMAAITETLGARQSPALPEAASAAAPVAAAPAATSAALSEPQPAAASPQVAGSNPRHHPHVGTNAPGMTVQLAGLRTRMQGAIAGMSPAQLQVLMDLMPGKAAHVLPTAAAQAAVDTAAASTSVDAPTPAAPAAPTPASNGSKEAGADAQRAHNKHKLHKRVSAARKPSEKSKRLIADLRARLAAAEAAMGISGSAHHHTMEEDEEEEEGGDGSESGAGEEDCPAHSSDEGVRSVSPRGEDGAQGGSSSHGNPAVAGASRSMDFVPRSMLQACMDELSELKARVRALEAHNTQLLSHSCALAAAKQAAEAERDKALAAASAGASGKGEGLHKGSGSRRKSDGFEHGHGAAKHQAPPAPAAAAAHGRKPHGSSQAAAPKPARTGNKDGAPRLYALGPGAVPAAPPAPKPAAAPSAPAQQYQQQQQHMGHAPKAPRQHVVTVPAGTEPPPPPPGMVLVRVSSNAAPGHGHSMTQGHQGGMPAYQQQQQQRHQQQHQQQQQQQQGSATPRAMQHLQHPMPGHPEVAAAAAAGAMAAAAAGQGHTPLSRSAPHTGVAIPTHLAKLSPSAAMSCSPRKRTAAHMDFVQDVGSHGMDTCAVLDVNSHPGSTNAGRQAAVAASGMLGAAAAVEQQQQQQGGLGFGLEGSDDEDDDMVVARAAAAAAAALLAAELGAEQQQAGSAFAGHQMAAPVATRGLAHPLQHLQQQRAMAGSPSKRQAVPAVISALEAVQLNRGSPQSLPDLATSSLGSGHDSGDGQTQAVVPIQEATGQMQQQPMHAMHWQQQQMAWYGHADAYDQQWVSGPGSAPGHLQHKQQQHHQQVGMRPGHGTVMHPHVYAASAGGAVMGGQH